LPREVLLELRAGELAATLVDVFLDGEKPLVPQGPLRGQPLRREREGVLMRRSSRRRFVSASPCSSVTLSSMPWSAISLVERHRFSLVARPSCCIALSLSGFASMGFALLQQSSQLFSLANALTGSIYEGLALVNRTSMEHSGSGQAMFG
jgi:hypothetical protein